MEFSRQESWSGFPFPSLGDLPDPGIEPAPPTLQRDSLPMSHQGSPILLLSTTQNKIIKSTQANQNTQSLSTTAYICHFLELSPLKFSPTCTLLPSPTTYTNVLLLKNHFLKIIHLYLLSYHLFSFDLTNLIYLLSLCFNFFWINSWITVICSLVLHSRVALEITTYFNELFSPKVNYFISVFSYNTSAGGCYNFTYISDFLIFYCHCACPLYIYIYIYLFYILQSIIIIGF